MAVRMIKKSWWVDFRFNHTRYRKRSPENSRAGALAYEATLRKKLANGETIEEAERAEERQQTFGAFTIEWFKKYVVPNNKPSEQATKKHILETSLIPFFGTMPVQEITTRHIEEYKARVLQEGISRKTVNNRLTVLHKCLATAYEWLELEGTPPKITWLKAVPPKMDYLTPEECDLLLAHTEGTVREMMFTALRTGMRQGEIKGLQWSSIDWINRIITVRHSMCDYSGELGSPKSNRERYIPMTGDLYDMLYTRRERDGYVFLHPDSKPFNHDHLRYYMKAACKKANLRRIGWHTLRHTFASHLVMKGAVLPTVQMLMGHSTINVTMRYAHLAPAALRSAIDLLNPHQALNFGQPVGNQWTTLLNER